MQDRGCSKYFAPNTIQCHIAEKLAAQEFSYQPFQRILVLVLSEVQTVKGLLSHVLPLHGELLQFL